MTMARKSGSRAKKKRTISPEHLAKMQAGRKRAEEKRKAVSRYNNVEKRLSLKDD